MCVVGGMRTVSPEPAFRTDYSFAGAPLRTLELYGEVYHGCTARACTHMHAQMHSCTAHDGHLTFSLPIADVSSDVDKDWVVVDAPHDFIAGRIATALQNPLLRPYSRPQLHKSLRCDSSQVAKVARGSTQQASNP